MGEHVAPASPTRKNAPTSSGTSSVSSRTAHYLAFIVGLFSVWQLYWTTYEVAGQVSQTIASYEEEHQPSKRTLGEVRTDDPPASTAKSAMARSTASSTCPPGTG